MDLYPDSVVELHLGSTGGSVTTRAVVIHLAPQGVGVRFVDRGASYWELIFDRLRRGAIRTPDDSAEAAQPGTRPDEPAERRSGPRREGKARPRSLDLT